MKIAKHTYKKLLTATYTFYICLSLAWLVANFYIGHYFNIWALTAACIFSVQAWYRQRTVNLALGIILLPASIFGALYFFAWGGSGGFDGFINTMLLLFVISLVASIFLIFSYLRLSFDAD